MINLTLNNEHALELAQQLGQHKTLQETVEKAIVLYLNYLEQKSIINEFGTVDFDEEYDYKKQRGIK